jgi:hypothetical protein
MKNIEFNLDCLTFAIEHIKQYITLYLMEVCIGKPDCYNDRKRMRAYKAAQIPRYETLDI